MVESVIILRHGLRLDLDDKGCRTYLKRRNDIPLSPRGNAQAEETAEYLKKTEKIDHIFCSPFFRALQTAHPIAEAFNLQIKVENGFIEMLNPKWFGDEYPVLLTPEERAKAFPMVDTAYESLVNPEFPETEYETHVYERIKLALDKVLNAYSGTIMIVGHGASTEMAAMVLADTLFNYEPFNQEMCALNKLVLKDGKWVYEYASSEHLSGGSVVSVFK